MVRALGSGAMADVYEIRGDALGNRLALKMIQPALLQYPKVVARFRREGQLQSSLHHRCIARVFDLVDHGGRPGLVMEFIDAPTLRTWLDRGTRPPAEVRRLATELLEGLSAAHARGVVHRDLKPSNVFVLGGGERLTAKIIDFGIAKAPDRDGKPAPLTQWDEYVGTYAYSSPEQLLQAANVDGRSDLFSLGVVLWEALSGVPPWPGTKVPAHVMAAVVDDPLPALPHDVPDDLRRLVLELTRKGPDERPQSAREALAILRRAAAPLDAPTVAPGAPATGPNQTRVVPKLTDASAWTPLSASEASARPSPPPESPPAPSPALARAASERWRPLSLSGRPAAPAASAESPSPRPDPADARTQVATDPADARTQLAADPADALTQIATGLPAVPAPLPARLKAHGMDLAIPFVCLLTCLGAPVYVVWLLVRGLRDGRSLGQANAGVQLVDAKSGLPLEAPRILARNGVEFLIWHGPLGVALWPPVLTGMPLITVLLVPWLLFVGFADLSAVRSGPNAQRLVDRLCGTRMVLAP